VTAWPAHRALNRSIWIACIVCDFSWDDALPDGSACKGNDAVPSFTCIPTSLCVMGVCDLQARDSTSGF
jgi:hypothetical protein